MGYMGQIMMDDRVKAIAHTTYNNVYWDKHE